MFSYVVKNSNSSGSRPVQRMRVSVAMVGNSGFVASATRNPCSLIQRTVSAAFGLYPQNCFASLNSFA